MTYQTIAPITALPEHRKQEIAPKACRQPSTYRILSLDGGGIRGILPATILCYLEAELRRQSGNKSARISDYFDLIAGTSTGGILACVYLTPDPQNVQRPKLEAQDALDLYLKDGPKIFRNNFSRKVKTLGGLWKQRYCEKGLESCLKSALGASAGFTDLLKPCIIPAYDFQSHQAIFFNSHATGTYQSEGLKAWQVARATTAAPSYFAPVQLTVGGRQRSLIDGALFARNPAVWAWLEAKKLMAGQTSTASQKDMMMVSISTGSCQRPLSAERMQNQGALGWIKPMMEIMLHTRADMTSRQLDRLQQEEGMSYHRINPCLYQADKAMDNVSRTNLSALHDAGLRYIEQHQDQLDGIIQQLMA